ncbi:MAG: HD domain-containing protein, partial [Lachnospiraceae bacterium]|nr:HD domain-containing protein [Lachnospiraceae bacterium]
MKKIIKDKVRSAFAEYTSAYDAKNVKVKLKIDHTYRVADIAEKIGRTVFKDPHDIDLCFLLGMLHDIGRFEQLKQYNTFKDSASIDHAQLSADILFKDGLISSFINYPDDNEMLDLAIRLHNVFILPDDLSERDRKFANILRDADKIDILKVSCDIPFEDVYDRPYSELLKADISDKVYEAATLGRNVDRRDIRTAADSYITKICFVYGLVF